MKRINAYETTDGTIFNDRKDAKHHQKQIDILDAMRHVANNNKRPLPTNDHLGDFLCDNIDAIEAALKGVKFDFAAQEAAQAADLAEVTASTRAALDSVLGAIEEATAPDEVGELEEAFLAAT